MDLNTDIDAVLMDIEGTTTSISFVYDELFPYARNKVASFLEDHWGGAELSVPIQALRAQAIADRADGMEGAVSIPDADATPEAIRQALCESVYWQMDNDRKTTGLKALQGQIWVDGYQSGALKGHLFADVLPAMKRFKAMGKELYIYSSGSVAAQKLLFGHSMEGDLTPMLSGYFDTTTGPKKEKGSYVAIGTRMGVPVERVLFLTDNLDEAVAADEAGCRVAVSVRPGNHPLDDNDFEQITSFATLFER
jgi:enolase-phosphatase E1